MSTATVLTIAAIAVTIAIYSLRVALGLPASERWRRLSALVLTVVLVWGVCLSLQGFMSAIGLTFLDSVSMFEMLPPSAVLGLALFELSPRVADMAHSSLDRVWKSKVDPAAEPGSKAPDKDDLA